ncbi:Cryptic beta-glucoside bgl operon antiterminator [Listeria grayi FSL F6-1183]|uniref:Cryptic beta-glucoside bgl operon antiterminator n=4 Tax=Listeria grayi TaxID=1641 RepID=A0A829RC18_LISGR|nr:Cryptic beta-glucoside bgl operon antiterminator [Listeria grayi FSL F6-1183]
MVSQEGEELIVIGKGISFGKKIGDEIDINKVSRVFKAQNELASTQIEEVIAAVPEFYLKIAEKIAALGEAATRQQFNFGIILSLADHIQFAVECAQQEYRIKSPLQWEMKTLFPLEVRAGYEAIDYINTQIDADLPSEDAYAIALHFVNANKGNLLIKETEKLSLIVRDIIDLINGFYNIQINRESIDYIRFVTHLKYYLYRMLESRQVEKSEESEIDMLTQLISENYRDTLICAKKINQYLAAEYKCEPLKEEVGYLVLHIERLRKSARNG